MPKKRKRRKPHRPAGPSLHRPAAGHATARPRRDDEPDLLRDIQACLRETDAFPLLALASSLLALVDGRDADPFDDGPDGPSVDQLLDSFMQVDRVETTALLTAIAPMLFDDLARRRVRRELERRTHRLPRYLRYLTPIEVGTPVEMAHVLGDGDNILVPVRTAAGEELTVVVYIDHNLGTIVKDAFVIEEPGDVAVDRFRELTAAEPDTRFSPLDPADARARIAEAIDGAVRTYPPFESDTWPASRPMVEWIVGELPAGGTGHVREEWDPEERRDLVRRFLDSPLSCGFRDELGVDQIEWVLWFACDYGPGDPLRWSTVKVELFLLDFLPRKIVTDVHDLAGVPDLLRAFIRFVHDEAGIGSPLTAEALDAIDRFEPEYQRTIRSPRLHGAAALMGAMGAFDDDVSDLLDDRPAEERHLDWLASTIGGREALDTLELDPLPDEPFDRSGAPDDSEVVARIDEVLALVDGACDRFFDVEHRTACRRLLADVASAGPDVLARGRADTAAASIVWLVATANSSFGSYTGGLTVGELTEWFGIKSTASQRAATFLKAIGVDVGYRSPSTAGLGSPRYLVSGERRRLVETRDRVRRALST